MEYKSVKKAAVAEFYEKKSKFIGHIAPVSTEEEAVAFLEGIKTKHKDATHNCHVYIIRSGNVVRFSDNGEPQGTAGKPMLEMLQKEGIVDICVVVTRYFGGIKLGTGGLARAYTKGAKDALLEAEVATMTLCSILEVSYPYNKKELVDILMNEHGANVISIDYTNEITMKFSLRDSDKDALVAAISELTNGQSNCKLVESVFMAL